MPTGRAGHHVDDGRDDGHPLTTGPGVAELEEVAGVDAERLGERGR